MDAIDLLMKDHEAAKALMEEIVSSTGSKRKKLFDKLKKEIEAHDHMEETIFYPTLGSRSGGEDLQAKDEDAHEEVEELLDDLAARNPDDEAWMTTFKGMREKLLGHVRDEEQGYFIRARKLLSPSELNDLGGRMQRDKEQQLKLKGAV